MDAGNCPVVPQSRECCDQSCRRSHGHIRDIAKTVESQCLCHRIGRAAGFDNLLIDTTVSIVRRSEAGRARDGGYAGRRLVTEIWVGCVRHQFELESGLIAEAVVVDHCCPTYGELVSLSVAVCRHICGVTVAVERIVCVYGRHE